eukprot:CAMPEP_0197129400 /NCGR_PEP_ID=MMETSP1390-20130617/16954_1 /TAXON_ID=38833 /ORGANISM="Micromonas sp., Strain CCMP2099" /LENGTH=42 /DNA_ID= /DNA_START= /DNA_END= /DNA_ORIENTATION=
MTSTTNHDQRLKARHGDREDRDQKRVLYDVPNATAGDGLRTR